MIDHSTPIVAFESFEHRGELMAKWQSYIDFEDTLRGIEGYAIQRMGQVTAMGIIFPDPDYAYKPIRLPNRKYNDGYGKITPIQTPV